LLFFLSFRAQPRNLLSAHLPQSVILSEAIAHFAIAQSKDPETAITRQSRSTNPTPQFFL